MNKLLGSAALAAVLLASGAQLALAAPHRGGELVFGRYADSLFLDPVLNDANVDIWILTNLYDTLLHADRRRQERRAGAGDGMEGLGRRQSR